MTKKQDVRKHNIQYCKKHHIIFPTLAELIHPERLPDKIKLKLKKTKITDLDPINLFRINWKNSLKTKLFGKVNYLEIPPEITGVKARIFGIVGKYFPTGSHKVGPTYNCLISKIISGEFDLTKNIAVWPSTGNFCRGGVYNCALLGCKSIGILPEEMSKERFIWLNKIGAKVISTPGSESSIKEVFDKSHELKKDPHHIIINQFDDFENALFHYYITAEAIKEVYEHEIKTSNSCLSAFICGTGSAGTIATGDNLKETYPSLKTIIVEPLQCPTISSNGYGIHRIEGIGDKHIPWIYNVRNTDAVVSIDDEDCMRIMRLFNKKEGLKVLQHYGMSTQYGKLLSLLGISSICNLLAAIKTAKYYDLNENDVLCTCFTDSMDLYQSRIRDEDKKKGKYTILQAEKDFDSCIKHQSIDYFNELNYQDKKKIHHLKYFTWVEQQGKTAIALNQLWKLDFWKDLYTIGMQNFDEKVHQFNKEVTQIT